MAIIPGAAHHRAPPLPADERRASLVAATIPLLSAHGRQLTTRQIAEAAGVAEGTLFRVFPDKDALIRASVAAACDPAPLVARLAAIDVELPLRPRVTEIVTVVQLWLVSIIQLMMAVRMDRSHEEMHDLRRKGRPHDDAIYDAVVRLLDRDSDQFRLPIREVARMVRLLTFSGSHPMIADGDLLTPHQIVGVLMDGVCRPPTHAESTEDS